MPSKENLLLLLLLHSIDNTIAYGVGLAVRFKLAPAHCESLNTQLCARRNTHIRTRALKQSSIISLACKKKNASTSKKPQKPSDFKGFGASAKLRPSSTEEDCHYDPLADQLTLQELSKRFAELQNRLRDTLGLPAENVHRSMLATRIDKLQLSRCRTATSSVAGAGQGLFATRDIDVGELITLYPGDAVLCWEEDGNVFVEESNALAESSPKKRHFELVDVVFGQHLSLAQQDADRFVQDLRAYEVPASDSLSIIGDPEWNGDTAYLGHMANDASSCTCPEELEIYQEKTASGVNAEHISLGTNRGSVEHVDGCHVATRAVKFIPAGQEIFVSYGHGYWITRNGYRALSQ